MKVSNIAFTAFTLMGVGITSAFSPIATSNNVVRPLSKSSLFMAEEGVSASKTGEVSENQHDVIDQLRSKLSESRGPGKKVSQMRQYKIHVS
jgi:hypothetical protein